jgi:hypothetical protein
MMSDRRSSVRSGVANRMRRKKRVRFAGIASPAKLAFAAFLAKHFRPGCSTASRWLGLVALAAALDCFTIPMHFTLSSLERQTSCVHCTGELGKDFTDEKAISVFLEISIDLVFLLDLVFRIAQAMVWEFLCVTERIVIPA